MILRSYQQSAIDAVFFWWRSGRQGEWPVVCLPTASGKTVIFSHLIRRLLAEYHGVSVLILAHRKELIAQAEAKLLAVWPEAPVGVYAAALDRREIRPITIASRDTIAGVIDDIGQFAIVIIDEAHNINQKEEGRYRSILKALKDRYEHLSVIGFTATPFRLGQGRIYGKGKLFADLAYQAKMTTLIEQGYLAPLRSITGKSEAIIDTDGIKTVGGDFDEHELADRATEQEIIDATVADWKDKALDAGRNHTVFFCVSILHAQLIAEGLYRIGIACPVVTGAMPGAERDAVLAGFAAGEYAAIANVGVLTEGWDAPRVDCIALLRPTKSASLYVQMVGRGLRLFDGKTDCLVLDYGGNIQRLGPVDTADEPEPKKGKKPVKRDGPCEICDRDICKTCGEWVPGEDGEPGRWRDGCGAHNHPAARECEACRRPFIKHDTKALEGGVISTEQRIQTFPVESVDARVATSKSSGVSYLRVAYRVSLFEVFYRNLMIGHPTAYAAQKAAGEWFRMTDSVVCPATPQEAQAMLDEGRATLLPVRQIAVDTASRWKDIVRIDYEDERPEQRRAA